MKYIRTKDGRIIKVAISKEEYERDYKNSNVSYEEWFGCFCFSLDILKQADTIEELFDVFVGIILSNDYHLVFESYLNWSFDKIKEFIKTNRVDEIYGAIWTDKGLIYVAKMNEKGELELL